MKADNDCWIPAQVAVERIQARLNVSVGKGQKVLSDAYASGEVRKSIALGRINPVTTSDGEVAHSYNDVSWSDLQFWLDSNYPVERGATGETKRPISEAALTKWFVENVDHSRSKPSWFQAAKDAHPENEIPRSLLRGAWAKVPESKKLLAGERPHEK